APVLQRFTVSPGRGSTRPGSVRCPDRRSSAHERWQSAVEIIVLSNSLVVPPTIADSFSVATQRRILQQRLLWNRDSSSASTRSNGSLKKIHLAVGGQRRSDATNEMLDQQAYVLERSGFRRSVSEIALACSKWRRSRS